MSLKADLPLNQVLGTQLKTKKEAGRTSLGKGEFWKVIMWILFYFLRSFLYEKKDAKVVAEEWK